MIQRGIATFGLDYGTCPKWLFERMVKLGREIIRVIVAENGADEFVRRLGDPVWFQSLGTVLAFDWNASGLTTILTAALKEALRQQEMELGIFVCGGKGKTSHKTPDQIKFWGERLNLALQPINSLIYNSKMAAKVDSALLQDGFQIYHHAFFFTKNGVWTVVQQGMNIANQTARRYHWHSQNVKDLIVEPHSGIATQVKVKNVLNMSSAVSERTRKISTELVNQSFNTLMKDVKILSQHYSELSQVLVLGNGQQRLKLMNLNNTEFKYHPVLKENFFKSKYLEKIFWVLCNQRPENYEKLLSTEGVGPKTIRALALVAEVIYGARPSYEDPARYSFAHGGKDSTPYPVDCPTYDQTIQYLKEYVQKSKIPFFEKQKIIKRLDRENVF